MKQAVAQEIPKSRLPLYIRRRVCVTFSEKRKKEKESQFWVLGFGFHFLGVIYFL